MVMVIRRRGTRSMVEDQKTTHYEHAWYVYYKYLTNVIKDLHTVKGDIYRDGGREVTYCWLEVGCTFTD